MTHLSHISRMFVLTIVTEPRVAPECYFTAEFFYKMRGSVFNIISDFTKYSADIDIVESIKEIQRIHDSYHQTNLIFLYRLLISLECLFTCLRVNRIKPPPDKLFLWAPERAESYAYFYNKNSEEIRAIILNGNHKLF